MQVKDLPDPLDQARDQAVDLLQPQDQAVGLLQPQDQAVEAHQDHQAQLVPVDSQHKGEKSFFVSRHV